MSNLNNNKNITTPLDSHMGDKNNDSKKVISIVVNLSFLFIFFLLFASCSQTKSFINQQETSNDSVAFVQIKTDSLFNSNQVISLLLLPEKARKRFNIEFAYNRSDLIPTSSFAKENNAVAAINGGFFNMDDGGSATYFEINDTVINKNRNPELKWGISDSIINGAIIMNNDFDITFQPAKSEQFYETSQQEAAVLITGPLLLLDSKKMELPDIKFSKKRHPRTCLCKNENSIVFITIDGRQKEAEGMNLAEVQAFLLKIGCIDAINLDGGGSTTMWTKNKRIVNFPSDKTGERPVANALLIVDRDNH